jgi:glycosyltransferase involved in cell wall biosynthesis
MTPDQSIPGDDPATQRTLIIIPTYDEKANIGELARQIFAHLTDVRLRVVNDNSPDGTADLVKNSGGNIRICKSSAARENAAWGWFIPIAC